MFRLLNFTKNSTIKAHRKIFQVCPCNKLKMMWVKIVEKSERDERALTEFLKNNPVVMGSKMLWDGIKTRNEQIMKGHSKRLLAFPTKTQLRILACLIDDRGHPLWEIAEELEVDEGYVSRAIKELIDLEIVYPGERRPSTHKGTRSRKRPEKRPECPLYINKKLEIIYHLHKNVETKLAHLGAGAPKTLKILSKWMEDTKDACSEAGVGIRLDPKPFTDSEITALIPEY